MTFQDLPGVNIDKLKRNFGYIQYDYYYYFSESREQEFVDKVTKIINDIKKYDSQRPDAKDEERIDIKELLTLYFADMNIYYYSPEIIYQILSLYRDFQTGYHYQLFIDRIEENADSFLRSSIDVKKMSVIKTEAVLKMFLENDPSILNEFDERTIKVFHLDVFDRVSWLDAQGNIKEWFTLKNGYKVKSKEEYMQFVDKYLSSDTNIPYFCMKYQITDPKDFSKLLDRIEEIDENYREKIREQKNEAKNRFIRTLAEIAIQIAKDELSFEELINNLYSTSITLSSVLTAIDSLDNVNIIATKHRLAVQICNYINNNRYSLNIKKLSSFMEMNYQSSSILKKSELYDGLKRFFLDFGLKFKNENEKANYYSALDIISTYSQNYNSEKDVLFSSMMVNDKLVEVTQFHRDQLMAYLELNKLSKTKNVAKHYLMEIVKGEIDYSKKIEENQERKNKNANYNQQLLESTNATAYFDTIDNKKAY